AAVQTIATGATTTAVAVGPVDLGLTNDIVASTNFGTLLVFTNSGGAAPIFTAGPTQNLGIVPNSLALADADGDNKLDAFAAGSNTAPITITSANHGLANGALVTITGVNGNTAANGTWQVANVTANTFELVGSIGNGTFAGGGTWVSPTDLFLVPDNFPVTPVGSGPDAVAAGDLN